MKGNVMDTMSPSEALFAFVGWLTTREEPVIAGASHDASIWANLIDEFCKRHGFAEPRDGWEKRIVKEEPTFIHPQDCKCEVCRVVGPLPYSPPTQEDHR